jgi:hypothetical protein
LALALPVGWKFGPRLTRHLVREDQFIEWLQVALLATAIGMLMVLCARWRRTVRTRGLCILSMLMSAVLLFTLLEEISWGQRVFGFNTPNGIGAVNAQGEFNLHNVGWVHEIRNYLTLGVAVCGLILASISRRVGRSAAPLWFRTMMPDPRMNFAFALFMAYGIFLAALHFARTEDSNWDLGRTVAEWAELMFSYCAFLYTVLKLLRYDVAVGAD